MSDIAGEESLSNIRTAIKEWQDKLCIIFKERQFEEDYIEFAYEGGYVEKSQCNKNLFKHYRPNNRKIFCSILYSCTLTCVNIFFHQVLFKHWPYWGSSSHFCWL